MTYPDVTCPMHNVTMDNTIRDGDKFFTFREGFCTVDANAINADRRWREVEHWWDVLE